jgi:catechol 2,3-dioxygenase-like lactoylglutathione lyase family enzyme
MTATDVRVAGVSHIALNTADLDRFRRFYEGVLGLHMVVVARLPHEPFVRHAILAVDDVLVVHVFEVPGYDPAADGLRGDIGHRGRIDHFGFAVPDRAALDAVAARLAAAGASTGEVRELGPFWSVYAEDPDGLAFEVTCPIPGLAPESTLDGPIEELGDPDFLRRTVAATALLR